MKLGILTSSRADYGIYKPLLKRLSADRRFDLQIIAFGTHLLKKYSSTIQEIRNDNFGYIYEVSGMPESDSLLEIGIGYGEIVKTFAQFWSSNHFDWIIALGDRFEMSAAVQASIPFEIKIAHLHGGETTLGATDNIYRHQISIVSKLHFVASEEYKMKVIRLTNESKKVFNVGALSLDGIEKLDLPSWELVCSKFGIPDVPFVLVTMHPETIDPNKNKDSSKVVYNALERLSQQIHVVATMSNADALGSYYRNSMLKLKATYPAKFSLIENFGRGNYFTAIRSCKYLIGNSSSGIIEAASFNKYVINIGDRQKGRLRNDNVIDVPFNEDAILNGSRKIEKKGNYRGGNIFYKKNTVESIVDILASA